MEATGFIGLDLQRSRRAPPAKPGRPAQVFEGVLGGAILGREQAVHLAPLQGHRRVGGPTISACILRSRRLVLLAPLEGFGELDDARKPQHQHIVLRKCDHCCTL